MTYLEQQQLDIYREWTRTGEPFTQSDLDDFKELKRKEREDEHIETFEEYKDARATRDSFQAHMDKLTVQPEGFREWPVDYFDATELQDSDSYKEFVNQQS